ncbi:hypothetical protein BpHYR1_052996 [Brachionus plicatilis]|uniref:Uncharacterized protein n=1 Tax=Brachionus plicatilis TaxID=10195 RepID=A0A3M7SQB8_BRAPC|nr:hypothetical protein BpHYR1_052996 [Brachionus plicatilis]
MFFKIYFCLFVCILLFMQDTATANDLSEEIDEAKEVEVDSKLQQLLREIKFEERIPRKRSFLSQLYKQSKRAFHIKTYFDALIQDDGSILLVPKDVNKNHYFIG